MAAKKTTSKRKTTKKPAAKRKTAKKPAAKRKTAKKPAAKRKTAKKPATKRKTTKKKTASKRKTTKKKCTKKKCSQRASARGHSLVDRARECRDLEECRRFIVEMVEAIEQSNDWLNEMHDQALSAEQARDLYGEQISDLVEAIDLDQKRIAQLEAELKKARQASGSGASQTVLRKLGALSKEVKKIRSDLGRLLTGRPATSERRRNLRQTKKARAKAERDAERTRGRGHRHSVAAEPPGPFAKYSVLRGAACSLGVGKHGYPPEVCAPAYFPRPVAAEILGTYAQNDYGGLAKWALITGLPIDDVRVPAMPAKASAPARAKTPTKKKPRTRSSASKKASKTNTRKKARSAASGATTQIRAAESRNSSQILDQVLLTIARI